MSPPGLASGGFSLVCVQWFHATDFPSAFCVAASFAGVNGDATDEALTQRRRFWLPAPDENDISLEPSRLPARAQKPRRVEGMCATIRTVIETGLLMQVKRPGVGPDSGAALRLTRLPPASGPSWRRIVAKCGLNTGVREAGEVPGSGVSRSAEATLQQALAEAGG